MIIERYPHLLPEERKLWSQFLDDHRSEYERFEYDVHVGDIYPEHRHLSGKDLKQVKALYQRRIDVVGYQPELITLFEVKPAAGLYAYGQILGYLELFEEDFSPPEDLRGAIVTRLVSPSVEKLLERHGIDVYVIAGG